MAEGHNTILVVYRKAGECDHSYLVQKAVILLLPGTIYGAKPNCFLINFDLDNMADCITENENVIDSFIAISLY